MTAALSFESVTIRYPAPRGCVLDAVTFSVLPGERVALFGLNGSGKSTLLLAAVGLVASEGRIDVNGTQLLPRTLATVRAQVGFVFSVPEDQLLFPRVLDDVAFALLRRGAAPEAARARARDALVRLGLGELGESAPHELSHGQKQRVALAGALITDPALLLFDEPTAGLDPPSKIQLANELLRCPSALLMATHDVEFAERTCSRYCLLADGRVVETSADFSRIRRRWSGT